MPERGREPQVLGGRYELRAELGRGAMGTVYEAFDRELQRPVALKMLHGADPDGLYRLKNEFRALARLAHPNLVRLYELVVEAGRAFFTMECVEGGVPLTAYVSREAERAAPEARTAARESAVRSSFRQLALSLGSLHRAGKVHRDLKPSNVLVEPSGRVVLLDFGLVGELESELALRSQVGSVVGTLAYMAPEQAHGRPLSAAADWYSFGVLLYEALTGRSPFAGASPAELVDRTRLTVPPPRSRAPDCAPDLADLAVALLAPDPVRRADEAAVVGVLSQPTAAPAAPRATRATPFVGRRSEHERLRRAYARAQGGDVGLVVVEGSSGIGKSALLERFAAELAAEGALVLRSRCYPHELVPFEALDEAVDELSRYLASLPPEELHALAPRHVSALSTVFPVLARVALPGAAAGAPTGRDPLEIRRRGFLALRELLARLADRRRLVVWIDDLQWADADSEPLLRELLRPPDAPPILWLLSYRTEDREGSALLRGLEKLLETLPPASRERVFLQPLNREECDELARRLAAEPLGGDALFALARASGGSPFLLAELLRGDPEAASAAGEGPLAANVEARLRSLPGAGRRLLEALVVAASPVDRDLARAALGREAVDPDLVRRLEDERLLRVAASEDRSQLEIYHDQIREVLDARLDPAERRARHASLAEALEGLGSRDMGALFEHHRGAGARAPAARYALRAADQAADQLAFDQAARFYAAALDLDPEGCDRARTLPRLAEAWANAGRGADAGAAFEDAAGVTDDAAAAEALRRNAAEQFLVSGHVEDGIRVLRPLLAAHGVPFPGNGRSAVAATLAQLPALALRYATFRPNAHRIDAVATLRIEACQSAAKGLVVVDPAQGACFAVRSLVDALRAGDVLLAGPSLCVVGASLVPLGGIVARWGRAMLRRAERMAAVAGDPYLDAVVVISKAQEDFASGRFRSMLAHCDRGAEILAERCRGTRWESDLAHMAALRALEELGDTAELRARLGRLLPEAVALDDLYAEVTFRLYAAFWEIARGEVRAARAAARAALERWGGQGFQLQHFYELRIQVCCDLYEGAGEAAVDRLGSAWPALRASGLLRHRMLASDALQLRARAALAAADGGARPDPLLREARRAARALERMARPDAEAAAGLIAGALAEREGRRDRALGRLEHAEATFRSAAMTLHAAYAEWRRGEILGGEEGRALVGEGSRALETAEIREPTRWLALQAPGFGPARGSH